MKLDVEQFKRDYLPLQPAMQRMAESLLGNEDDAADVVQDCYVKLWADRERLSHVVNREAWCITLVKRRCIDLLRQRRPSVDIDELVLKADEPSSLDEERLQLALRLLDRLPDRQAQVVRLRHFDALDTPAIARTMQVSEGNVYTLLSRAYNSLKQMILKYEDR